MSEVSSPTPASFAAILSSKPQETVLSLPSLASSVKGGTTKTVEDVFSTTIPEKDTMIWQIEDFEAFRNAAKVAHIPPLVSPEFGGGCQVRLWPWEKEHVRGVVELPPSKWGKDGLTRFRVSALRPDGKVIIVRNLELKVARGRGATRFAHFNLSKKDFLQPIKYQHLVYNNAVRLQVEMEYYPYDAPIFKGFSFLGRKQCDEGFPSGGEEQYQGLLHDVEQYCKEDPQQNAQVRCGSQVFPACRFLLAARSKRFRAILRSDNGKQAAAVTINDVDAATMDQILGFIHHDKCEWLDDSGCTIQNITKLFEAADSYQIASLLKRVGDVLACRLNTDNVLDVWDVADKCSWEPLKEECIKYMDSIPGSQVATMLRCGGSTADSTPALTPRPSRGF